MDTRLNSRKTCSLTNENKSMPGGRNLKRDRIVKIKSFSLNTYKSLPNNFQSFIESSSYNLFCVQFL